ncbi:colorectal cancer associated 2 [Nerophis ophidion]|uniref:colorectal cancer associated 2 n=1 Tax=Nerophis ophidion TaxID=159077 RepID=UPI002ADF541C|nr:colorectal cancer associated 2 [Nerophis ophidion]
MADKVRVYQGVRVKTTVKQLLQRHRARLATRKRVRKMSETCLDLQTLSASTLPNVAMEAPPMNPPAPCGAAAHLRSPASSCLDNASSSQQPFAEVVMFNNNNNNNNNKYYYYNNYYYNYYNNNDTCLPAFPPWSLAADHEDLVHEMGSCSSPESLKLCSPADSLSSSSPSSCYDSPPRMDNNYSGFMSEQPDLHHASWLPCDTSCLPHNTSCLPHTTSCLPHTTSWLPHNTSCLPLTTSCLPDYSSYYPNTDSSYCVQREENCYKINTDMSYNVL